MDGDFVFLYRKIMDSPIATKPNLAWLFVSCVMLSNWKRGYFELHPIERGQFATSHNKLGKRTGLNRLQVQRGLKVLAELEMVSEQVVNSRFTIVTVCNYGSYQDREQVTRTGDEQVVNRLRTGREQVVNTIEEGEEGKETQQRKKKNTAPSRFVPPTVEKVTAYCQERGNTIDPGHFMDYHIARGWKLKGGTTMKNWQAVIRTWEKNGYGTNGQIKKRESTRI